MPKHKLRIKDPMNFIALSIVSRLASSSSPSLRIDLKQIRDCWFHLLIFCTVMVALGVFLEEAEESRFPSTRSRLDMTTGIFTPSPWIKRKKEITRIGWILILLGVVGEGLFEAAVSNADGMLQDFNNTLLAGVIEQAGAANARASANEVEAQQLKAENLRLEAIIAPRSLSLDQQRQITDRLRNFAGHPAVEVSSYGLDAEALSLAGQLISIIRSATGTMPMDRRANFIVTGGFEFGVQIRGPNSEREFMSTVTTALTQIGKLKMVQTNGPSFRAGAAIGGNASMGGRASIGGGGGGIVPTSIPESGPVRILVGVKPMPDLF
jgi:hypothetical protein